MTKKIRLVMADDHELFRDGFAGMFVNSTEFELLDSASDGRFLLALVEKYRPDVVLTDIQMGTVNGFEVTREIVKKYPGTPVIALSMFDDSENILGMLRAGACGYLVKSAQKETVLEAIRAANRGENYYCQTASSELSALIAKGQYSPGKGPISEFNETELKIIQLLCEENSNEEIAGKIFTSLSNVRRLRAIIMEKAGVKSLASLVLYAVKNGLVKW
jgi:DNA-binding NarL/FixJ family response regulator